MALNEERLKKFIWMEVERLFDKKFDWFNKKIDSEEFIDDIVERINRKQLK